MIDLRHGDCLDVLRALDTGSVDSVVTDPPYELGFMGRSWDSTGISNRPKLWAEVLRVLKPGSHLLAFSGTRTQHRMVCAIEDAGFEVRDQIGWLYGSGFPKSLDVSKAIDKAAGVEREVVGFDNAAIAKQNKRPTNSTQCTKSNPQAVGIITAPATDAARQWAGWGTALKPAWEPICVARKPLAEPTVAAQVLATGTGAINVDGCRVVVENGDVKAPKYKSFKADARNEGWARPWMDGRPPEKTEDGLGRWPANLCHDGSDEVLEAFAAFGEKKAGVAVRRNRDGQVHNKVYGEYRKPAGPDVGFGDTGTAARFFYCAKASRSERGEGNSHPTVKPLALMRWLVRLVTPPGGLVLDPFGGSGTTGLAAQAEGFRALLIEREAEYVEIIKKRIAAAQPEPTASDAEQLDLVSMLNPAA